MMIRKIIVLLMSLAMNLNSIALSDPNDRKIALSQIDAEHIELYKILKSAIYKTVADPYAIHFLPYIQIDSTKESITIGTFYYDSTYVYKYEDVNATGNFYGSLNFYKTNGVSNLDSLKIQSFNVYDKRHQIKKTTKPILEYNSMVSNGKFTHADFKMYPQSTAIVDSTIYKEQFEDVSFANQNFCIVVKNGQHGVLSQNNKFSIPPSYSLLSYREGYFVGVKNSKYYVLDRMFNTLINGVDSLKINYFKPIQGADFIHLVKNKGKVAVYDKNFKQVLPYKYCNILIANNNSTILGVNNHHQQILLNSKTLAEESSFYDKIDFLFANIIRVQTQKHYGLIQLPSTILLDATNESIDFARIDHNPFDAYQILKIQSHGKYGLWRKDIGFLLPVKYEDIKATDNFFIVKINNKFGTASITGQTLVPAIYDSIYFEKGTGYIAELEGNKVEIEVDGNLR